MERKDSIVQAVILNEVLLKRRVAYESIRKGLSSLGMLKIISAFPLMFEQYFVRSKATIQELILNNLQVQSESEQGTKNGVWLKDFVSGMASEGESAKGIHCLHLSHLSHYI